MAVTRQDVVDTLVTCDPAELRLVLEAAAVSPRGAETPRALAERRQLPYAPSLQTVAPQIINERVVADAAPRVSAQQLDMNSVNASAAPTQINRASTVVERVSRVNSIASARASARLIPVTIPKALA